MLLNSCVRVYCFLYVCILYVTKKEFQDIPSFTELPWVTVKITLQIVDQNAKIGKTNAESKLMTDS